MRASRLVLAPIFGAGLLMPAAAYAGDKGTVWDHVDQIVDTFLGNPMADVDFDMKHVLDRWRAMHPKPLETLSAEEARRQPMPIDAAAEIAGAEKKPLEPYAIDVRDITIPGAAGPLHAKVFTPTQDQSKSPLPVVVFYHGGGFVLASDNGTSATARAIAGTSGSIVVAPDYRLAPEHKFPAAPDDAFAAYKWIAANAASFGGDPTRIALAGEGAGGMLATDTAMAIRDAGIKKPAALVLITPAAGTDLKTNSWLQDSAARPWNDKAVRWAIKLYLSKPDDNVDPRIDIVGKADVANLPPTTIVTAEVDPLRSDGERLGGKLKRATVPVSMRDYTGVTHDFFGMGQVVEKAATAQQFVAAEIKKAFSPPANQAVALEDLGVAPYPQAPDPTSVNAGALTPRLPASQGLSQP